MTSEQVDLSHLSQEGQQTYYTCTRFIHLPHWLNTYQKPMVCLDMDVILEQSLTALVEEVRPDDVAWITPDVPLWPWESIGATVAVVYPSPCATDFFS